MTEKRGGLMTNEEAIETLRANYPDACFEQLREAVDVAIATLTAQPESAERNEESKQNVPNDDLIYRKIAIEKFWHSEVEYRPTQIDDVMSILKGIPSAQPDEDQIHTMKEQEYMRGWEEGRNALREEMWEDERDRLD